MSDCISSATITLTLFWYRVTFDDHTTGERRTARCLRSEDAEALVSQWHKEVGEAWERKRYGRKETE